MIELPKLTWAKFNADVIFTVSIVVARAQMALMLLLGAAEMLTNDPNTQPILQQVLPAQYIPWAFIALGIITELAHARRRHNDRTDPDGADR